VNFCVWDCPLISSAATTASVRTKQHSDICQHEATEMQSAHVAVSPSDFGVVVNGIAPKVVVSRNLRC
jgi:hypothetical protein